MRRSVSIGFIAAALCTSQASATGPVVGPHGRPFCPGLRGLSTNPAADLTGKGSTYAWALRVLKRKVKAIGKHCHGVSVVGLNNVEPVAHPEDRSNKEWLLLIGFVSASDIPTGNWDLTLDGVRLRLVVEPRPHALGGTTR